MDEKRKKADGTPLSEGEELSFQVQAQLAAMIVSMPKELGDKLCLECTEFLFGRPARDVLIIGAILQRAAISMMPEKFQPGLIAFYKGWVEEADPRFTITTLKPADDKIH
jgi:hypothetical protein